MRKVIAAALSILVGAFGYTIVDNAIEERVSKLESDYVSLQEVVSNLSNMHTIKETTHNEALTTEYVSVPHTYPTLDQPVDLCANFEHPIKFYLRLYSNGQVRVISPGDSFDFDFTTSSSENEIESEITYEDHWLYITDSSAQLVAGEDFTRVYMDDDYSTASKYESTSATIMISVKGYTAPALAGKKLQIGGVLEGCWGSIEDSGIIGLDGAFSFTQRIDSGSDQYKLEDMRLLKYNISYIRILN